MQWPQRNLKTTLLTPALIQTLSLFCSCHQMWTYPNSQGTCSQQQQPDNCYLQAKPNWFGHHQIQFHFSVLPNCTNQVHRGKGTELRVRKRALLDKDTTQHPVGFCQHNLGTTQCHSAQQQQAHPASTENPAPESPGERSSRNTSTNKHVKTQPCWN